MKYTLSVLVENHPGVLSKVSGLFSRRGFNIDSLAVGITEDPAISRMTIVVDGDEHVVEQVEKQLNKVIPVIKVKTLVPADTISRTLSLIKVSVSSNHKGGGRRIPGGDYADCGADAGTHRGRHPHHHDHRIFRYHGADGNVGGVAPPLWDQGNRPHRRHRH